jgi:hypothetical protein
MDERLKARYLIYGFILFVIISAFLISTSREKITGGVVAEGCEIECSSNEDCDDMNDNTMDGCAYPGSCSSRCFHEIK